MVEMGTDMDALFGNFMNELTGLKSAKRQKTEANHGTPEEIIERMMKPWDSAFAVLSLTPDAEPSTVTRQYRKLSVLVHPDKCSHPDAAEAFQKLAKAYAQTKDPNYNDKYKDIIGSIKKRIRKEKEAENTKREKAGEDPLPTEGFEFDREVLEECEKALHGDREAASHSNSVLEANLKRMADSKGEAMKARQEEAKARKGWEKNRDKRVAGWQIFMKKHEAKEIKSTAIFGKVGIADMHHKREERSHAHDEFKPKESEGGALPMGTYQAHRKEWR